MSLPNPDYSYRSPAGESARLTRQHLDPSALGRQRTPAEEVEYWEATISELILEFPGSHREIEHARHKLAEATAALP